jgi:hypothetical protein
MISSRLHPAFLRSSTERLLSAQFTEGGADAAVVVAASLVSSSPPTRARRDREDEHERSPEAPGRVLGHEKARLS